MAHGNQRIMYFLRLMRKIINLLDNDPGKVRANLFDLVCNGVELGSGSIRIHDRKLQEKVFDVIGYSAAEVNNLFGHLLRRIRIWSASAWRNGIGS